MNEAFPPFLAAILTAANLSWGFVVFFGIYKAARVLRFGVWNIFTVYAFLIGWYAAAFFLAQKGVFEVSKNTLFPVIALGVVVPIFVGLRLFSLNKFRALLTAVPQHWLIGVQIYRTLGIVFLLLYARGLLPAEFAFPSGYGDIFIGVTALPVAYWYFKQKPFARALAIGWNFIGIADLVLAVVLGFLTSPTIIQTFAHDAPNQLITAYPLVMVPVFAVPLSMLLHLFSLRALRRSFSNT